MGHSQIEMKNQIVEKLTCFDIKNASKTTENKI
jgi:hypothetical protein